MTEKDHGSVREYEVQDRLALSNVEIGIRSHHKHGDNKGEVHALDHIGVSTRDPTVNCRFTVPRGRTMTRATALIAFSLFFNDIDHS